jgi:hypothetical protein
MDDPFDEERDIDIDALIAEAEEWRQRAEHTRQQVERARQREARQRRRKKRAAI